MVYRSISRRLLTSVLSVYFILTFIVTCGQIVAEYFNARSNITDELQTLEKTFSGSLTRAIWELNTQQALAIAEGLLAIPTIEGIVIRDENGEEITTLGKTVMDLSFNLTTPQNHNTDLILEGPSGLFGYSFPLIFEFSGRATPVGSVTLFSSREVIFGRIKVGIYFLIGNAIVKTTFLIFLFLIAFRKHLTEPLSELTQQIADFDIEDLEHSKLYTAGHDSSELKVLEFSYNDLVDKLQDYKEQLENTQQQLLQANRKLDEHNLLLEQEVARKTSNLSQAMLDLERQKKALEQHQQELQEEIVARQETESALKSQQRALQTSLDELKQAQERLLESEKMASLGGLVAGIAHDVNTPVGIGVTATSFLADRLAQLDEELQNKTLSSTKLQSFIEEAKQSTNLLTTNLDRASELIASFKQVAVDQTSEAVRDVELSHYVNEIIHSLRPKLKSSKTQVSVQCEENLQIRCPAGAISQIFTNLILNSVVHGFDERDSGEIQIDIKYDDGKVKIDYEDNGKGISQEHLDRLFDPFFTTKRGQGGSGLGTHIMYNLVTKTLNGEIQAKSTPGEGLYYHIEFPAYRLGQH